MKRFKKEDILTAASIIILLFTSMINWNIYSWLILVVIIFIFLGWYFRRK